MKIDPHCQHRSCSALEVYFQLYIDYVDIAGRSYVPRLTRAYLCVSYAFLSITLISSRFFYLSCSKYTFIFSQVDSHPLSKLFPTF